MTIVNLFYNGNSAGTTVVVEVSNVNEAPVFADASIELSIPETIISGDAVGEPIVAKDPEDQSLTYAFRANSIVDTHVVNAIGISADTGQLVAKASMAGRGGQSYYGKVIATDPEGQSASVPVTVLVERPSSVGPDMSDFSVVQLLGPEDQIRGPFDLTVLFPYWVTGLDVDDFVGSRPLEAGEIGVPQPLPEPDSVVPPSFGSGDLQLGPSPPEGYHSAYTVRVTPAKNGVMALHLREGATAYDDGTATPQSSEYRYEAMLRDVELQYIGYPGPVVGPYVLYGRFSEITAFDPREINDRDRDGFSKVTGITVENGGLTDIVEAKFGGPSVRSDGRSFLFYISPTSDGDITVRFSGEAALGMLPASHRVTADLYRPAVTVRGPSRPVSGSFTVTVSFNKEGVFGFDYSDLDVVNGVAVSQHAVADNHQTYEVTIRASGSGTVRVTVPEGTGVLNTYYKHHDPEIEKERLKGNFRSPEYSVVAQ